MQNTTHRQPAERLESDTTFEYAGIWHALLERAWLITLCVVVGGFIAAGLIMRAEPRYESRLVLQIEQEENRVLPIVGVDPVDLKTADFVLTLIENLKSRDVLRRIVHAAKLPEDMTFPAKRERILTESELVDALKSRITVNSRKGTRLVDIVVEDPVAERAQRIGRALVEQFLGLNSDAKAEAALSANKYLTDEVARLQGEVARSELALQQYKDSRQAVSLEEKQNIVLDKLKDLNIKLTQAKSERLKLEADLAQVSQFGTDPQKLMTIASIASQRNVGDLMNQVSMAAAEMANLTQRYRPKHPKYIQTSNRLEDLKRSLDSTVLQAADGINISYQTAKSMETKLGVALREQEQAALDLEKTSIEYKKLAREVESNRTLYESVLKRLKETDATKGLQAAPVHMVEAPSLPTYPTKPNRLKIAVVCVGCSLMLGLGLALGSYTVDQSLRTVAQAEAATGISVIAAVPKHARFKSDSDSLVLQRDPNSSAAEAFRTLRSSLGLLERGTPGGVVLVTSSSPSEGKSFTSANLAVACAQLGQRTLLIDADLRRPTIDGLFFDSRRQQGLADLIAGTASYADTIHETSIENLYVLPAGLHIQNPAELLTSPEVGKIMGYASTWFDRVVIDTAPVHAVSDTLHLLQYSRSVCLVVRAGHVPASAVDRAARALEQAGRKPAGLILNMVPQQKAGGYYYYYSAAGYGGQTYGGGEESAAGKARRPHSRSTTKCARQGSVISALMDPQVAPLDHDLTKSGPKEEAPLQAAAAMTMARERENRSVNEDEEENEYEVFTLPADEMLESGDVPALDEPTALVDVPQVRGLNFAAPVIRASASFLEVEFRGEVSLWDRQPLAAPQKTDLREPMHPCADSKGRPDARACVAEVPEEEEQEEEKEAIGFNGA